MAASVLSAPLRRTFLRHALLTCLLAVVVSGLVAGGVLLFAQQDAYRSTERVAEQVGTTLLVPLARYDFSAPIDADERVQLDADIAPFLSSGMVRRVKVWTVEADGARIAYSDEPQVEGEWSHPDAETTARLDSGDVLVYPVPDDAEHRFEAPEAGALLEAFLAFRDSSGKPARLEVYVPVDEAGTAWHSATALLPIVVGGIAVLALATLPLSLAFTRRVERERREQREARRFGLAAAESSRRELARHLHDDVIPDLAGASILLDAVRAEEAGTGDAASLQMLDNAHEILTGEVRELRALLTRLVPATSSNDLAGALRHEVDALLGAATGPEPEIVLAVDGLGAQSTGSVFLARQAAGELLRNAHRHAAASRIEVAAGIEGSDLELRVSDDGVGFDPSAPRDAGHVGLVLVERTLLDHGGLLEVSSRPGGGTVATVRVPLDVRPWDWSGRGGVVREGTESS